MTSASWGRARLLAVVLLAAAAAVPAQGQDAGTTPAVGDWAPTQSEYQIQPGDTMWDISERVVGSPWMWPRVWAYNPEIVNPHWIYPGDVLRFYPTDLALPRLADLASSQRDMPQESPEPPEPPPAPEGDTPARKSIDIVEAAPIRRRAPPIVPRTFVGLFVTESELAEAGVLTNSSEDKMLLSTTDRVFLTFPDDKVVTRGDRFMIYRTAKELRHPVHGDTWGYLTQVTGFAVINSFTDGVAMATIFHSTFEIERGQLVTPLVVQPVVDLTPRAASQPLEGYVLAVENGIELVAGEERFVFVDLGKEQGLEVGNRLSVYIGGDPLVQGKKKELPDTRIATLMVVDVKDSASTCLVLDAVREIEPGQKVRTIVLAGPMSRSRPPQASAR